MAFTGFSEAALDFYDDLEMDNTKTFWEANKHVYAEAVATPFKALAAQLEGEFGQAKIFRPYRDVRFAKDKTPYKTHQGMFVATGPATGYYLQLGADGVRVGAGYYEASATRLASLREAMVDQRRGKELEDVLAALTKAGWELGGDRLKTAPRGYDKDHPRIELLRHKSMTLGKKYGFDPVIHTPDLIDAIRADWRETTVLLDWVQHYVQG